MACWQDIIAIPVKKQDRPAVRHLTVGQTRLCSLSPTGQPGGPARRDPARHALRHRGQGLRTRQPGRPRHPPPEPGHGVADRQGPQDPPRPLDGSTVTLLAAYLKEHRLDQPGHDDHPVFYGQHRAGLSRGGIAWIIRKYQAQTCDPRSPAPTSAPISCVTARPCTSMRQVCRCPTSATFSGSRPVNHRDLRQSLDRGEAQGPRGRLPGHRHQRPARVEPGRRPPRLADQPLIRHPEIMRSAHS